MVLGLKPGMVVLSVSLVLGRVNQVGWVQGTGGERGREETKIHF